MVWSVAFAMTFASATPAGIARIGLARRLPSRPRRADDEFDASAFDDGPPNAETASPATRRCLVAPARSTTGMPDVPNVAFAAKRHGDVQLSAQDVENARHSGSSASPDPEETLFR